MSDVASFGRDHGLIHEVVITGRKVGAGQEFWSRLAHDEELFRKVVELVVGPSITLTSDGTTGEEWITRLKKQNFRLSDYAKQVLRSSAFVSTTGVTYNVAIIKGTEFSNEERTTSRIREVAASRGYATPHPEVACLLREKLSDEELEAMGLWWLVTMHEPINVSGGGPRLLGASRDGGGRWLDAYCDQPDSRWDRECGFAFVVPQN